MGLEVVVNEIIAEGRRQAAAIEKEGLVEAKAILEEAKAKAEKLLAERETLAGRDAERIRVQETARADFEAKKQVLVAKRELWERLKREALDALGNLPEDQRRRYLHTILERAAAEVPDGVAHVRSADAALVRDVSRYRIEGDLNAVGGVVVESPDGSVSLDYRFESILDQVWPQVLKQESKNLFG